MPGRPHSRAMSTPEQDTLPPEHTSDLIGVIAILSTAAVFFAIASGL